ncbi:MAG TPA: hypothetical protein VFW24_03890 [Acidimicrobiales bacterium]|nr:hypothetical protein [Acidimicrobiales bacterium]
MRLLLLSYPDVMAALVALALIVAAGITSMRWARARERYETWWSIHLYLYLALALSLAHQIANGQSFVGHPVTIGFWSALWAATAGTVLAFRFLLPIGRSLFHRLRVVSVREEAPGVVSIVCAGRHLDRLAFSGGQFFRWRFLRSGLWWQAHPYSLSALPRPPYIRVTVKGLGDQSAAVARIPPGTRVWIEGPYGAFTHHARRTDKVLLIGPGVGVTPLRAILEELPPQVDVTVVLRSSTPEQAVLAGEMQALVTARRGRMVSVTGSRQQVAVDRQTLLGPCPTWPSGTCTCAVRTDSPTWWWPPPAGPACPARASTGRCSPSDETRPDRRRRHRSGAGRPAQLPHHVPVGTDRAPRVGDGAGHNRLRDRRPTGHGANHCAHHCVDHRPHHDHPGGAPGQR